MTDLTLYTRESLEAKTVSDLDEISSDLEISGSGSLNKGELINAILMKTSEQAIERLLALTVLGTPDLAASLAQLSVRVRAVEAQVAALNDKTRASTQILGSN